MILKFRRNKQSAVRHSRNIKNSEKSKSKKNTKIIRTTQPPANSTEADSKAILPNRIQVVFLEVRFPIPSRRQLKSFLIQQFFKNAGEVWASSPHLRSKLDFAICFSCCNCIFWSCPIQTKLHHENQGCKFEQGNGAIAARWQAKAGVEPPFAGCERSVSLIAIFALFHVKQCS